jgi:Tfp pilus assembly major pilin PilA
MASEGTKKFVGTVAAITVGSVLAALVLALVQKYMPKKGA